MMVSITHYKQPFHLIPGHTLLARIPMASAETLVQSNTLGFTAVIKI